MLDPHIVFQGIDCPKLRQQAKDLIEDLTQLCPSDSCVNATFGHLPGRFLADIKIASESVFMQAVDSATALSDVMDHIKTKLMGQIVDWRNQRFMA